MDPLTAIAAFNASYAVVKTAASNASELGKLFASLGKMQEAKNVVESAARNNPEKSDLELYAAKVEVDQKWEEVRQLLIYSGHWDAYLKFVADRKRQREEQEKQDIIRRVKKRQAFKETLTIFGLIILAIVTISVFIVILIKMKPV
jgi:predicted Zn-dependent protease